MKMVQSIKHIIGGQRVATNGFKVIWNISNIANQLQRKSKF